MNSEALLAVHVPSASAPTHLGHQGLLQNELRRLPGNLRLEHHSRSDKAARAACLHHPAQAKSLRAGVRAEGQVCAEPVFAEYGDACLRDVRRAQAEPRDHGEKLAQEPGPLHHPLHLGDRDPSDTHVQRGRQDVHAGAEGHWRQGGRRQVR